ncbi:MAG: adenylate/guanylate cyclase domain-containing protein [Spirochaetales bacterium]|nr:adenylate/guanylate cyclase domain-containing protein [Spirochaetales bacterium]
MKTGKKRLTPITTKVNFIIIISLILGIGVAVYYFLQYHISKLNNSIGENITQQADILYNTIETLMIPGNADLAIGYFKKTNLINPDYQVRLYRADGELAFSDDTTIKTVNAHINFNKFALGTERLTDDEKPVTEYFQKAQTPNPFDIPNTFIRKDAKGDTFFRIYQPLQNIPVCFRCHGSDHTYRGVIDIRNKITDEINSQFYFILISIGGVLLLIALLTIILTQFLRNTIIKPVKIIGNVCSAVTTGVFSQRAEIKNNDEIGVLGNTVNTMVEGLRERYELSKYVSASTIQSLKDGKVGKKVPLTILFSDIRSFTSFSEQHVPEDVVEYLNKILSFQTEIIQKNNGDIDKYVGDEIVALYTQNDPELSACKSALEIQKELQNNSDKLYNGLKVGIGINTGEVILGMIGSEKRADYTVIGDNVNLASRLCGVAKPGQIIIARSVYEAVKAHVIVEGPYKVRVKGKKDYNLVYLLNSLKGEAI